MPMATRKTSRKTAKRPAKAAARKASKPARKAARAAAPRKVRPGFVTHTELISTDPAATKAWAAKALGWAFGPSLPMPDGTEYHMWQFADDHGGGIRPPSGPEAPGAVPYVEVPDIKGGFDKAVKAGATGVMPPMEIPGGHGWMALVQAPGGPIVGLWSNK
jgi:predicted enzyme related to lactoylglutathione lyase